LGTASPPGGAACAPSAEFSTTPCCDSDEDWTALDVVALGAVFASGGFGASSARAGRTGVIARKRLA
jgi:hypothetical protein